MPLLSQTHLNLESKCMIDCSNSIPCHFKHVPYPEKKENWFFQTFPEVPDNQQNKIDDVFSMFQCTFALKA